MANQKTLLNNPMLAGEQFDASSAGSSNSFTQPAQSEQQAASGPRATIRPTPSAFGPFARPSVRRKAPASSFDPNSCTWSAGPTDLASPSETQGRSFSRRQRNPESPCAAPSNQCYRINLNRRSFGEELEMCGEEYEVRRRSNSDETSGGLLDGGQTNALVDELESLIDDLTALKRAVVDGEDAVEYLDSGLANFIRQQRRPGADQRSESSDSGRHKTGERSDLAGGQSARSCGQAEQPPERKRSAPAATRCKIC